ncbi:DUF222 domain-containing protein [Microbacterium sp. NPDC089695]|uniref:HNH endonuclease signature motif containing protein n=1 Tax=Microbacterium sp. NPDC089695 TaxID=3364198 RepID=UPI0037FD8E7A
MPHPADALIQVAHDLDAVLSVNAIAGVPDHEKAALLKVAGAVMRRVEAVVVETIATSDPAELAHECGCRVPSELVQRALLVDRRAATRVVRVAGLLRRETSLVSGERLPARWPDLRDALLDGVISVDGVLAATAPVERIGDRIGVEERLAADAFLADSARGLHDADEPPHDADGDGAGDDGGSVSSDGRGPGVMPEDLGRLAQQIAMVLDPDGEEPDDQQALHRRGLTIGRLRQGLHRVTGHLLPDAAAQLQAVLDAMLNPKVEGPPLPGGGRGVRFEDSAVESAGSVGVGVGVDDDPLNADPRAVVDPRTHAQKRHDALAAALGIAARHRDMPSLGGAAPTLVVTVDVDDLARGTGRAHLTGSDATLPVAVAEHIACAGAVQRVLTDKGRIVATTTTDRIFTVHQRRAIVARDKECLIPGCHVPASWCEIHHVVEHARGGPTSTDNGVPLCWWHHRSLGSSGWEIRMNGGVPQVRGPAWWDPDGLWRTPRLSVGKLGDLESRPRPRSRFRSRSRSAA